MGDVQSTSGGPLRTVLPRLLLLLLLLLLLIHGDSRVVDAMLCM